MTSTLSLPEKGREFYLDRESLFGSAASNPERKPAFSARSRPPDRQIDQVVYELYGLTEEGIKIVEEAAR